MIIEYGVVGGDEEPFPPSSRDLETKEIIKQQQKKVQERKDFLGYGNRRGDST